jgi:outer membrane cobalamin receptor
VSIVRVVLPIALSALIAGCGIKPRPSTPNLDAGTIITDEEIAETGARTMWEALQRTVKYTRFQESGTGSPERIRRRGSSSIVLSDDMPIFIDHVRVLEIKVLSSMPARDIERIQVLNGVYATTYYGTNSGDGVILIRTREAERNR